MIDGVKVIPLKRIPDERGTIYHILRADAPHFIQFGEAYMSKVYPGIIKGWHIHKTMCLNYTVVSGMVKLVLYDSRPDSPTKGELMELFIGDDNYCLVQIPRGVVNGHKGMPPGPALLINVATEAHTPGEMERLDPFTPDIPYNWDVVHK